MPRCVVQNGLQENLPPNPGECKNLFSIADERGQRLFEDFDQQTVRRIRRKTTLYNFYNL
jgi:hypothetical protein